MLKVLISMLLLSVVLFTGCSNKVLVKKETCKEVYGGALYECEKVSK